MIKMLVDQCHVSWSNRQVIRHVISKMKHGYSTFSSVPRADRKKIMKEIISYHTENQKLYVYVMGGRR